MFCLCLQPFTFVGAVIFCITFLLMILSRRLEYVIMAKNGPKSHVEYAQYIKVSIFHKLFIVSTVLIDDNYHLLS